MKKLFIYISINVIPLLSAGTRSTLLPLKDHVLMQDANLQTLYDLAQNLSYALDKTYGTSKEQVLIGLGQSPAYILKMMEFIDLAKGRNDREYKNLAFSGRWHQIDDIGYLRPDPTLIPIVSKNEHFYLEYLKRINLSPADIASSSKNIIILEIIQKGESLFSFITLLRNYSKQPFYFLLKSEKKIVVTEGIKSESYSRYAIPYPTWISLIVPLMNDDQLDTRLVAHYAPWQWPTVDPLTFKPTLRAELILWRMKDFVANKSKSAEPAV